MKTAVVYKSKSGHTKTYAQWISENLGSDLYVLADWTQTKATAYDTIVYGGGVYAGKINGLSSFFKKTNGKNQKIFVFACGMESPSEKKMDILKEKNFREQGANRASLFVFRGGFSWENLSFVDGLLMKFFKKGLSKKTKLLKSEEEILSLLKNPQNFTNQETIVPLLDAIKKI